MKKWILLATLITCLHAADTPTQELKKKLSKKSIPELHQTAVRLIQENKKLTDRIDAQFAADEKTEGKK